MPSLGIISFAPNGLGPSWPLLACMKMEFRLSFIGWKSEI
jgi:hypothetical protein